MTRSSHVAIFITDYAEAYSAHHGSYADLSAAHLKKSGLEEEIRRYDIIESHFPTDEELEDIKAIWITGSKSDAFSDEPWILKLKNFLQEKIIPQGIPIVGVCFGHQITSRALGAKVGRNEKGWELGVSEIRITEDPEVLELLSTFPKKKFEILEVHQDVVYEAPEGFKNIGSSDKAKVQGIYKKGKALTFQGHPEFNKDLVREVLENKRADGTISEDHYKESVAAMEKFQDDNAIIGKIIVNFISNL